ncbi:hypothetical protein D7X55_40500, partial [Corallococcus sp. AB049A]
MLRPLMIPHLIISPTFLDGAGLMTQAKNLPQIMFTDVVKKWNFADMLMDCYIFITLVYQTVGHEMSAMEER